jgi:hypothetical protein
METHRHGDPRLHIDTLEAKLAERNASLAARDTELTELRAELDCSPSELSLSPRRSPWLAVGLVLTGTALGVAYVGLRLETARVRAAAGAELAKLGAARADLETRIEDARAKTVAASPQADPPPPSAHFGDPSDRAAIAQALEAAASSAATCALPGGPTGTGTVKIRFDALEGRVDAASIEGPPFAGSVVEPCVLERFLRVRVGAFKSPRVTLTQSFTIR